jgi:chromosomal replication initiator protein
MEYAEEPVEVRNEGIEQRLLAALAAKIEPQRFELWFKNSQINFDETKLVIGVQSRLAIDMIRSKFLGEIEQACIEVLGRSFLTNFVIIDKVIDKKEAIAVPMTTTVAASTHTTAPTLVGSTPRSTLLVADSALPKHSPEPHVVFSRSSGPLKAAPSKKPGGRQFASLTSFVEGLSNRLAYKAADLAVHHSGEISPIYLFGPSSVGKTHLLEGIYSAIRRQPNSKPPLYLTAEQFISSFLTSIHQKTTAEFRERFKGISILLIDDIQYLSGKRETQTEFLNTIDVLRTQGVQLVFTGDRSVKELTGFRNEIICRLEAGMVCPIEQPERETMLHIFRNMVQQRRLPIGDDVCRFVASRLNAHARQLSGALNRLHAVHLANGEPITLKVAEETLDDLIRNNRRSVRLQEIDKAVCETFGLSEDALKSRNQTKQVAAARMLAMWLARKHTRSALSEIGKFFGGRAHSTVFSTLKKVDAWIDEKHPVHDETFDIPLTDAIRKIERIFVS